MECRQGGHHWKFQPAAATTKPHHSEFPLSRAAQTLLLAVRLRWQGWAAGWKARLTFSLRKSCRSRGQPVPSGGLKVETVAARPRKKRAFRGRVGGRGRGRFPHAVATFHHTRPLSPLAQISHSLGKGETDCSASATSSASHCAAGATERFIAEIFSAMNFSAVSVAPDPKRVRNAG